MAVALSIETSETRSKHLFAYSIRLWQFRHSSRLSPSQKLFVEPTRGKYSEPPIKETSGLHVHPPKNTVRIGPIYVCHRRVEHLIGFKGANRRGRVHDNIIKLIQPDWRLHRSGAPRRRFINSGWSASGRAGADFWLDPSIVSIRTWLCGEAMLTLRRSWASR